MTESVTKKLGKVIQIDEEQIREHLGNLVRGTVEETLNKLLDAEADQLCNAACYERTDARKDNASAFDNNSGKGGLMWGILWGMVFFQKQKG